MLAVRIIGLCFLAFLGTGIAFFILTDNGVKKGMLFLAVWIVACVCAASCLFNT